MRLALAVLAVLATAACSDDDDDSGDGGRTVATFQVVDETYKIELATPELIDHAQRLLAGEEIAKIPNGTIVRDDPSVNAPWSWHIDPATLEFADMTIEVCDGLPSFVEDGSLTSDTYCPWSAEVIAVEEE